MYNTQNLKNPKFITALFIGILLILNLLVDTWCYITFILLIITCCIQFSVQFSRLKCQFFQQCSRSLTVRAVPGKPAFLYQWPSWVKRAPTAPLPLHRLPSPQEVWLQSLIWESVPSRTLPMESTGKRPLHKYNTFSFS